MYVMSRQFFRHRLNHVPNMVFVLLMLTGLVTLEVSAETACIACHSDFTPELLESFQLDVHAGQVDCSGCHGGNPNVDPDDMESAHGTIDFRSLPWNSAGTFAQCSQCHEDVASDLNEGPHRAASNPSLQSEAPSCTDCHGYHPIYKLQSVNSPVRTTSIPQTCGKCHADDEMMEPLGLSADIPNEYRTSVHGIALLQRHNLDAPSCVGCHDNHGSHNEDVASFDEACARCHLHEANAFKTSKHQRVWELSNAPVCITCHNNHLIVNPTVEMLGTQEGAICAKCHNAGDPPDRFRELLRQLEDEYVRGQAMLVRAQRAHKNVKEELAQLDQVRHQLEKARESVHYFDLERLRKEVQQGLLISASISNTVDELVGESSCVSCHLEINPDIVDAFRHDVHGDDQISCHGCHGGNPLLQDENSMSSSEGFVGVPKRPTDFGEFCGKCHSDAEYMNKFSPGIPTDQLAQFQLSGHGRALIRNPNDDSVAHCTDCHGTHGIRAVSDPLSLVYPTNVPETCNSCHGDRQLMIKHGIKVNPYEDYVESVHGKALLEQGDISAPACNDCHGNHGATPPGVDNIANVCGQCHALNAELFKSSIHRGIWELRGLPQCESCHGNHAILATSDDMLSTSPGSYCAMCHEENSAPDQVRLMLQTLELKAHEAEERLMLAESYLINIDEGYFKLDKARSELTKMRVLLHRFDLDTLNSAAAKTTALIDEVVEIGDQGIKNAVFRRNGFLFALVLFALFVAVVIFKIRELDLQRKQEQS